MNNNSETNASLKKSSHIFFIYLFTLIYVLITALSITQVQLLLNDKVNLPIIGVGVNITFFIIVSPFILVTLFIIYNLHYLHLKKSGDQNVKSFYYWPIFEFGKFNSNEGKDYGLNILQSITSNFIIWGLLPLTLFVICFIYLPAHESFWTWWLIFWSSVGNLIVGYFWVKNDDDIGRIDNRKKTITFTLIVCSILCVLFYIVILLCYNSLLEIIGNFINSNKDTRLIILGLIVILLISAITTSISWKYFKSKVLYGNNSSSQFLKRSLYNIWIIILLSPFIIIQYTYQTGSGKNRNLDVSYQVISQSPDLPHKGIYSVNLRSKDLRYANLIASVLSKADMRGADLSSASLYSVRLDSANLEAANLKDAVLLSANLSCAYLRHAHLEGANLKKANLTNADLFGAKFESKSKPIILDSVNMHGANLEGVDLRGVSLEFAELDSANLKYADLRGVEINYKQLEKVNSLYHTKLDSNLLKEIQIHNKYLLDQK